MKPCTHTSWLRLCSNGNKTEVIVSDRPKKLLKDIPYPDDQQPSLIVFIGNATKTTALRELFGVKRSRRFGLSRGPFEIHLHLEPASTFLGRPLLIAEGDLSARFRGKALSYKCHEVRKKELKRPMSNGIFSPPQSGFYSKLLFPFTDVFCIFCDDLGGLRQVAQHLAAWLEDGCQSTLPATTRPRIILVTEKLPTGVRSEKRARADFLSLVEDETAKNLLDYVSALDILPLTPGKPQYELLKNRILIRSDQGRKSRSNARSLFSLTHYVTFLNSACDHFCDTPHKPFDFIKSSREKNPVAADLEAHISHFLEFVKSPDQLSSFAAPIVASSLVLDSYPPDAHRFLPRLLFETLYSHPLAQAIRNRVMAFEESNDVVLRTGFLKKVEAHFEQFVEQSILEAKPVSELHRRSLARYKLQWLRIHSRQTCLICLRRNPICDLKCGHGICEICAQIFGKGSDDDDSEFIISKCFLCQIELGEEVRVKIHPPTAGVGVLCIDGGGVRGTIPLRIMKRIHDRMNLPMQFQRFFKVAFGISSGGLIAADLFLNGHSVDESSNRFEDLAKVAFQRRDIFSPTRLPRLLGYIMPFLVKSLQPLPQLLRVCELLVSYFGDGLYSPRHIEEALKEAFGTHKSISDVSSATATGTLVGLPVATTDERPTSRLFTNYNGATGRDEPRDSIIKPKDGFRKLLLWEIGRAVSAAVGFFPPKHIDGIGSLQDAGPLENDPVVSALSTVAAVWPHVEQPDFVVSLGTGEPKPIDMFSTADARNVLRNGVLTRLSRLFWEKTRDGKLREVFQANPRYHRLNVQFDGGEPRLDDVQSIPDMKLTVDEDDVLSKQIDHVVRCLIASLFYFELDATPDRSGDRYVGTGHIFCSIKAKDLAFPILFDRLKSAKFQMDDGTNISVIENGCFDSAGNFRRLVRLNTDGNFAISLDEEPISRSPFSVEKLIDLQGFSAVFGSPNHRKRKRSGSVDNPERKRRRIRCNYQL